MDKGTINQLEQMKAQGFTCEGCDKDALANTLLKHIGDPDSSIRDDLIYPCLAHLFHEKHFNEKELTDYLNIILDRNHLMYDIKNKHQHSVLTRSFSLLQLVVLIRVHRRDHIINQATITFAFNRFLNYFNKETVLKGYSDDVGWIHTIAHSADVMDEFMQVNWFKEDELKMMFEVVLDKMKQKKHVFVFNEDERMVVAIKSGLTRNMLSEGYILDWIDRFASTQEITKIPDRIYLNNNIKHFLRSLYFSLVDHHRYDWMTSHIQAILTTSNH